MKNQKILLTTSIVIIVAIIVIFILFVVGNDAKNKESNFSDNIITSDQVYEMYISINPIVKISFKERYLKCENEELNNKCNLSTEITEYELVNDDAKDIYKDIDFYEKDIIEVIPKMVDAVNNSNINFTTINIITNWNGVYNESLVSNAIEENSILGKEYNVNINVTESIDNNSILNQQVISRRNEKKHILVLNAEAMEEKELTMHLLDSINTEYAVEVFGSEELIKSKAGRIAIAMREKSASEAILPAFDFISSSLPIIIPPDSSPPNNILGFLPRLISLPRTSVTITSFSGLSIICLSTFFIMFAISLNPTGTLTTFTPLNLAHSSQDFALAVVFIINLG